MPTLDASAIDTQALNASALEAHCINAIRFLAIDMVEQAQSGHPGAPMGMAAMAYALWTHHLRFDPQDPEWMNRDRFVLSNGHASAMLYALLHLSGFAVSDADLRKFRQLGSILPGHPERGVTPGVEITTGPLGQGFANAVGMAIAERFLAATFNREAYEVSDHYTYVFLGDGCMEEGISSEAASLAGHLGLGRLIAFYDDNRITIDGPTSITFTEDVAKRFEAYGWQVIDLPDGNDVAAIDAAIIDGKRCSDRPTLLVCHTHIGFGSPGKQDSPKAHGSPLGAEEVAKTRAALDWNYAPFEVPDSVREVFLAAGRPGTAAHHEWDAKFGEYAKQHPELASSFSSAVRGELAPDWDAALPRWSVSDGAIATRNAGGAALTAIAKTVPTIIGGSADLNESTFAKIEQAEDFQAGELEGGSYAGRTINFGVREHAMGAIVNGIVAHGGVRGYGSTFFSFVDYMREPIRLAAMMELPSIFVWTHDSIALGEDGPTHQPVEHLAMLRATPNFTVIRPADANETVEAWRYAMTATHPVGLVLTRQKLAVIDEAKYAPAAGLRRGAYILSDCHDIPALLLIATGSEVSLALEVQLRLATIGIATRVISMPSWEIFEEQSQEYRDAVLPHDILKLSIEAGSTFGWSKWVGPDGISIGIDRFGASGKGGDVLAAYGFTVDAVAQQAIALVRRSLR